MDATTRRVPRRRLWFSVAAPPAAWGAHGMLSLVGTGVLCGAGNQAAARALVIALTAGALALAIVAGLTARGSWHRLDHPRPLIHPDATDQDRWLAMMGALCSGAFGLGILLGGLPALLMRDLCRVVR